MDVPFEFDKELIPSLALGTTPNARLLPGYPRMIFESDAHVYKFLEEQFLCKDLQQMGPRLWWMSKQSSDNISPLHRQQVKNRNIIVSENPRLHLVWYYDKIFIKPLPKYLLSHAFWTTYLTDTGPSRSLSSEVQHIRKAALGYLRTYFHLVQHESDFRVAQDSKMQLIPEGITWERFCAFSHRFNEITDGEVSERYHYGEIRLSRLNFYCKLLLRKCHYHRVNRQYKDYFFKFYAPLLGMCAMTSLVLNAMQGLSVDAKEIIPNWTAFYRASFRFSVFSISFVILTVFVLMGLLLWKIFEEWRVAIRDRQLVKRKRRSEGDY